MRACLFAFLLACAAAVDASAEEWSVAVGSGPFVFGHFAERNASISSGGSVSTTRSRLSAATRAGGAADVERSFGRWLSVRLEGSWTRAPLSIKSDSGSQGVAFDAGRINVTTFVAPLVLHINGHGAFRFHVMAGPAYALYKAEHTTGSGTTPLFDGTRGRAGVAAGIGVGWWLSDRTAVEWKVEDVVTRSPLHVSDVSASRRGVRLMQPHNAHTTIGARYRF